MSKEIPDSTKIRNSVNWVNDFEIGGVDSDANGVHDKLYRLEQLIIEQLPYTDASISKAYDKKFQKLRKAKAELFDTALSIKEFNDKFQEQSDKVDGLISKIELAQEAQELMSNIEEDQHDDELRDKLEEIYEKGQELFEERDLENDSTDFDKISTELKSKKLLEMR